MTKDWPRLAEAVAKRRRELGLSQDAIRQAGGPSDVVIARIENDEEPHPRDDTINKLDGPLRWEPGSAQQVLAGGDPDVIERTLDLREISNDELLTEIRRRFEEAPSGARRHPIGTADKSEHFGWGRRRGGSDDTSREDRHQNRQ